MSKSRKQNRSMITSDSDERCYKTIIIYINWTCTYTLIERIVILLRIVLSYSIYRRIVWCIRSLRCLEAQKSIAQRKCWNRMYVQQPIFVSASWNNHRFEQVKFLLSTIFSARGQFKRSQFERTTLIVSSMYTILSKVNTYANLLLEYI